MATLTYFRPLAERDLPALEAMVMAPYAEDVPGEAIGTEQ